MELVETLVAEARDAYTPWTFGLLVVVAGLARVLPSARHQRLPGTYALFALHVLMLLVTAGLVLSGSGDESVRDARIVARILGLMALVGLGGALVFGVIVVQMRVSVPRILQDLIVGAVTVVVIVGVLTRMGVALGGLIPTAAVVSAVLGFSLQDTLGNTIGGLALQADGSIKVGDWVKVNDVVGKVSEIRWRYTAIETRNWETVLLPNSVLMKGPVIVLGRRVGQPEYWRRWVYFNVDFRHHPSTVIDAVTKALRDQPIERVSMTPPPNCVLMDLTESYGRYAVRYWLTDLAVDDPTDSLVRTRIMFALQRAEIPLSIPAHAVFVTEDNKKHKELKTQRDLQRRIDALHAVDLFAPLDDNDLLSLAQALHPAPFAAGEIITKQGAVAHWLYLVVHGEVAVKVAKDGLETEVARMSDGTFFGEMSLMTGEPRSATVVGVSDVDCYRLDAAAFKELVKRRPDIAKPIAQILAERRARTMLIEQDLDAEARARRQAEDERDLLSRMKSFFGLD
jgi:small-conductance mechanosensitive channel/CRP-like cAMP-binding protein